MASRRGGGLSVPTLLGRMTVINSCYLVVFMAPIVAVITAFLRPSFFEKLDYKPSNPPFKTPLK